MPIESHQVLNLPLLQQISCFQRSLAELWESLLTLDRVSEGKDEVLRSEQVLEKLWWALQG